MLFPFCLKPKIISSFFFFFLNDTPPTEIYPLPLHDALPIWGDRRRRAAAPDRAAVAVRRIARERPGRQVRPLRRGRLAGEVALARSVGQPQLRDRVLRSEEHTSELQSHFNLVFPLLLEKKKN